MDLHSGMPGWSGTLPYVIAEIGVNHGGSLEMAERLIDLAWAGGADAAKFQTYKAGTLAIRNSPSYWDLQAEPTTSQYELFRKYDLFGPEEYRHLAAYCAQVGIVFLSTPFDEAAVELLDPLVPFHKVASADITNVPLLRRVAVCGKPVVLSTGASTLEEIRFAVAQLEAYGAGEIALLHCVLNYPTQDKDAHLELIRELIRAFPGRTIGYSDHTLPDPAMTTLTAAWLLGARLLEKHFTHDKTLPGNDHYHAMDRDDLRYFRAQTEKMHTLIGLPQERPLAVEETARQNARRSIVTRRTIAAGEILGPDNLTTKRPGTGLSPIHWDTLIGRSAAREIPEDLQIQWGDLT